MQAEILIPGFERPYVAGDRLDGSAPLAAVVDGFATADECAALIARVEALGPDAAPISTVRGAVMRPDVRNNARVMFDDADLAARLFARLAPYVPARLCGRGAVGLNERFRGYRYTPGQRFAPHSDGAFTRHADEASLLTLLLYLDDGCQGRLRAQRQPGGARVSFNISASYWFPYSGKRYVLAKVRLRGAGKQQFFRDIDIAANTTHNECAAYRFRK